MARHRKTFECGHKGFGSFCHRCRQIEDERARLDRQAQRRRARREDWEARFDNDPVPLRGLPRHVVEASREVIAAVEAGTPWGQLGGKKLRQSGALSIPIGRSYRLVCLYDDVEGSKTVVPLEVLSHEDYNKSPYL
jgi:hypothetical protein